MGPAAYPWGFPLMLAPVYALMSISPLGMKLPGLLTYLGFLLTFFYWMKTRFTPTESLLAVSLFGFNPRLLLALDSIGSDIPFLFLSTLTLLLADRYTRANDPRHRRTLAALTGVSIFAATFVRTQGFLLLGAVLLWQGIRFLTGHETRRQIVTEALITMAGFGVLWGVVSLIFPGGQTSYLSLYQDFSMSIVYRNISTYSLLFGDFFVALPGSTFVFGMFVVLFFIGLAMRWKDDLLVTLYTGLYLLVLWSWPEWQGYRMIFPLLPVFIYFAFWGIKVLLRLERGKGKPKICDHLPAADGCNVCSPGRDQRLRQPAQWTRDQRSVRPVQPRDVRFHPRADAARECDRVLQAARPAPDDQP